VNPLYLQTLRRHRRLFVVIVIAAVASAMWMNLGAPKMYRAGLALYADAPGAAEQLNGAPPPAALEQTTLNELLTTRHFRDKVAHGGPLAAYLKSHPVEGWGPGAIVASLRGGGGALDPRIEGALSPKRVTSAVLGPHVLEINYDAPSPALARETLQVLIREYQVERVALPDGSLASYRQQLEQTSAAVRAARKNLRRYVRRHSGSGSSSTFKKLTAAERAAIHRLADAAKTLQLASSAAVGPAPEQTVRVIDGATLPKAPTTGHKQLVKTMLAGLFAGLLVSGLGVVALTKGPQLVRGSDVVAPDLDPESDAVAPDLDLESMSDAELARLIHDMEEWPTANGGQLDESIERRTPSD
jgi:hypothetical protein